MNKIYKVVWSKVRNAYVVVSELAKRNSKTKSQHTSRVSHSLLSLAVVSSLALGLVSTVTLPAEAAQRVVAGRYPGTQDNDTMAVGANATATGAGAVSVGTATTNGEDALAVGTDASATGIEAIAIGGATAAYNYAIAMGDGAIAGGTYSVGGVTQSGANAVAIGKSALAYGLNDVVIGANQTAIAPTYTASEDTPDGTGLSSALGGRVMIGHDNIAYGRAGNSVIVGSNNRSNAIHGIAIGQNAYAGQPDGSTLAYENTMSIGTNTRSYSTDAIAIGNNAVAGNTDTSRTSYDGNGLAAAAIGSAAKATSFHTVAIGSTSQATDVSATAIGDAAVASAVSTTAVGNGAQATSIGSLAAGAAATASDQYTIAVGNSAKATALRSMALGYGAVSSGGGAVAIGRTSQATGSYANSLGYENTASGNSSLSVGYHTYAYGTRSIAIGREAVSGTSGSEGNKDTIAIGSTATTQADSAIAIGNAAKTDGAATSSIALGKNAATGIADSVAIGSKSSTTRATDTTSQGWNNQDSTWTGWLSTKGNAGTTSGGVWNSSAGVVSIGTDGFAGNDVTRKLTGLAAGVYDTDAVNMKQWTNTMLATTGDYQVSGSTQYGSDGTPRTATKLLNESLKITGGVDTTLYEQSDFATNPNIGAFISNNTVTLRLNKALTGLTSAAFTDSDGNRTAINGKGVYITPASGSRVTLTTAGLNNGNNRITNVAAGTANTDAVNVSQLNQAIAGVSGGSGTTTTVTVEGGTAAGTSGTYTGNNLQLTSTTGTGTATYDLKLADNVTLGSTGTSGTDGSLTVNGKDGESVAINGSDGTIALTGADGSTATIAAGTAANDVNGNSVNRITAGGQTVATLNDGMVYTGDTGSAAVKLNKTVNIVGGETDSSKLSTDNNIGIVAAQDGDNGKLTVRLAKDITGLNTVEAGDAVLGNQGVVTAGGTAQDGSYVTGLDNTTWNVSNPDIVTGRAATEDQLKTVSDAVVAVTDGTSENATGGFGLTDDSGTAVKQDLGKTIQIAGDGNVTTTADAANGKITVGLSNTIGIGTSGSENGTVTVNGADGSAVAINGADGSISLNTGSGSPITIQAGSSVNDVTGSPVNRITVGGQTVATMNDGMKYGGDFGTVSNVKLNNQVDVKGEATTEADLTTGNIGVVSSQAGDNGLLTVKLNKDINLGSTGSLTFGSGDNTVSISNSGLNNGGNKITNVATGTDGTDAVNVDQLTKAIAGVSSGEGSKTNLTVEGGTAAGTGGNYAGSNLQVTEKTETTGATTYDVKLADNITLGSEADSAAGTEGTDGSITVNGKDGSAVAINGADGSIALNTADGSPVTIQAGTSANNLAGNPVDRITVGGQTVATMSDGLKFAGDDGQSDTTKVIPKTLNEQLDIVGGAEGELTDKNIGVNNVNGQLKVQLVKDVDLGSTGSLTLGNTVVNNNGITITPATGDPVSLTGSGLDNGNNVISNVATGVKGTDAVNVDQLTKAIAGVSAGEGSKTNLTVEGGTAAGTGGNYAGSNLQITEKNETTGATTYDVKLADNITLGSAADSAAGTEGTDSSITVNGKDGSAVAINGADGSIALNTDDGSPVTIKAGTAANDVNGKSIDRVTVGGATVATLDDGMVYTGDTGTAAVKLNKTVNIVGGETDSSKLSTDNNIGIAASQDGDNGKLTVRLAKDITGLNTVEAGDAVLGNQSVVTAGNVAQDGSYVTGLDNTSWNVTNPDIVTGRAATEDQLKTVSDALIDGTGENATGGFGLTDDSGTAVKQDLGKMIQIAGDGNVTTTAGDGKITVGLSNTVALGDKGTTDGSMTVNGADGSSVAINGSNGSIVMNTADGSPVTIQAGTSVNDVTGSPVNRITVGGQTVATMNDGMKYGGDFGTVSNVKLNNQVDVKGEATTEADLTTGNIGVVSSQAGDNGLLTVKLNKDINLGSTGSLTFGSGDNTVSISNSGLNNGGNKITNVATGTDGTDAVNVDQLTKAIAGVSSGEGSKTNLTVEGGTAAGTGGNYAGSNLQVTEKTETTGATTYDVKLADNITLGSEADSAAGTEGTDGSITVNGKDGSAVAINGADGSIALNTADGSPVTIQAGTSANNLAGNPVDRITVGGQTVATMSDGLKFAGDDGQSDTTKVIPKTLNEQLDIVGGAEGELTDKNIGVNNVNGQLKVQLVKDVDLGSTGSLTLGNTVVNNNGITITPATGDPVSLTGSGLDNGNNVISNVATGVKGTDAVNVDQLTKAIAGVSAGEGSKTNLTVEGGTAAGTGGNYAGSNLQITEKNETTGATTYDVKLADNITLGSAADSAAGTEGTDSSITVNGKDGSAVAINGADGSIALNTDDGSPVTIKAGTAANDVNGKSIDRVTVGGATVATLDDGMVYTGDTGSAAVKLNKTVNIVGGETDSSKLSTDNNIGIVAEQDGDNGKLTVRLAKDITGLNTVTAGDATIGTQTETTANGVAQTGSYVTGLDNTEWNVADPDIVTGRAATEDQLKTVSDAVTNAIDGTSENATGGFGLADGSGTTVKQDLGKTITVKGGVTDGTATTDNPTGTSNITTAVKDGALEVSLNKDLDLGSTGSVTTGNTVVNNDGVKVGDTALTSGGLTITNGPSVTTGGIDGGSKQITNVASGSDGVDDDGNPTYNNLTNGANIGDIKNITDAAKTELTNDGLNFTADSGDSVHRNLGETLNIAGDGNITTTSDADNGKITVGLSNTIALGEKASEDGTTEGIDGSITVNGKDGSAVAINGADGSIALNTGSDSPITIQAGSSVNDVTGTPVNRITVGGQTVATMNDGMKYGGDFGTVSNVKLNNQVDVKGEATTEANLTSGNIGVVSSQAGDNGLLVVKLNKDIDLGEKGSVTTGNTVVNNSGLTITNGPSVTTGGIDAGGSKITNVATGTDGTDAVNVAQLEKRISDIAIGESKTTELTVEGGKAAPTDGTYAGSNLQVTASTTANGSPTYDVKLADNITLGSATDSESGTTGTDGSITLNGANGSSVAVNGADGSVTAKGTDGSAVVINGADGSIGLTGPAGEDGTQTTVTIAAGNSVNNVDGTPVDRITAGGQTIATMSDGQKYAGDNAKEDGTNVIAKKLNEQLDIVGGADADKLTENNIGVNNVNGQLKVQLAQNIDLGKDGSVTMGNTVVNNSGLTIANGPSVTSSGINAGESKITNVADGDVSATSTDAVNGSQLKAVQDIAEKHTKVTVEGGTEAGTTDYAGNNLQLKATTVDGQTTYDLKLADNLSIGTKGADGKDGVDGSIGVNGKDGSSVVINGTDGISVKGADGKDGVTITGKDGVDGVDGAEGHIGLNGKDGMTDIYTTPGQPGVNGQDGDTMTRIIYTDPNEANHEVATLDDGMKYTGDTGSAAVALNKTVNIVGGETDSTKLSTDNNIGIVAEQADDNAKLTVRLAKDITGLNTVTAGEATIGNQSILTAGGVEQDGSYVTGLDNTSWNVTNPDIVSGRAATEDQLKIVTDTVNALADGTSENATGGFGLTDDSGTAVKQDIGKTIQIAGDGNITTTADATSGKLTVGLSNTIALGEKASEDGTTEGADSSITVNGKDGSSVAINGADGTIALNTADGSPVTIAAGTQVNNLAGTPIDRITIGSATVATLDDGMKYYGDFGDVASVKLNNQVNVKGEANSKDDLTTGNIGVVSAQDGDNALLTVKLNKDINLGSTGSVTTGNTVINNSGVTITPTGGNPVTLTDAGLNNGDNKITNVAPGAINEDSMDAVNGSQLNEIRKLAGQHTYVTVEGGTEGEAAEYAGKNLLLQTRRDNNLTTYYDLKLSDNITLGSANDSEGTGGVDSSITLNGAAGSSVAINGGDGSIALTGANGSTATIAAGTSTPNLAGTAIDRITAGGSTVATLDDGMKYGGDFGDTSKVKLNNQVNVKGNAKNEADLTDGNIGVVSIQDGDNGQLLIKLNKDLNLGDTGSVTMGNTVINNSGVTIGSGTSAVTLTDKGLNNGGNQITNVASGTTGKTYDTSVDGQENYNNAANIGDLTTAINDVKNADNGGGFGLTADDGKSVKQDLGSTITVTGDNNIETKVTDDGKLQVGLKDNVDLGQNGSITAGNTTIDKGGVSTDKIAIKDSGISIDKDGINAGNKQIKDVGSGLGNTYDTSVAGQENYNNGANIGDVYNIAKGQADAVKAQSGKNITVGDDNKVNLNDNITLGDTTDPSKQVNIDGNGATVTAGSGDNQVKLDGSKGQISAGGAVLGNQENTANDGNPATGNYLTGLDNTKWDSNNIQSGRAATEDQLKVVDDKVNKGRVFQGDDGADNSVTVGLGDTLKLNGGADTSKLSSGNIGVVRNSSGDGLDIKLAKDLKDLDSVTTGNTTINDSGVTIKTVDSDRTITIQDSNVNMGNNVVSGVADGTVAPGSTEAINGGQLALRDQAINSLGGEVNKLDNRINRVGAGAAALAALHPQDFDPDDKWDFAFGYGHYRGANAGAFGAFYKPNEDTTFSVGGTIGGGENMINAGVSFKLGQGNNVSNSRVGMAKEIKHLRDDVAKLEDIVNRQSQMINQLTGQNPGTIESKGSELFPDVPANHWAYEYVTKLHQLGIIEGYPDGNFDGNRMMTRYEFAAVVYRAIMAGAASNAALQGDDTLDRLANEFSAELKYIRIDTIAKDKDGKPTIQRVRIVPENKQN